MERKHNKLLCKSFVKPFVRKLIHVAVLYIIYTDIHSTCGLSECAAQSQTQEDRCESVVPEIGLIPCDQYQYKPALPSA